MQSADQFLSEVTPQCSVADWDRIYNSDKDAMPSQSHAWANAICKTGGYEMQRRKYLFSDGIEAAISLFSKGSNRNPLRILRSPPAAWGFGGPVSTRPLGAGHLQAVLDDCARLPGAAIQIRPNPVTADIWAEAAANTRWVALPRNAHVLDLAGGFDEVWSHRFPGRIRTLARKAEKNGITVETGSSADIVTEFDALFRLSILRWARKQNEFRWLASLRGHLRDPRHKFLEMARLCADLMRVTIARKDGKAIAGIVVLYGRNAHYTRGAMDEQAVGNSGANALLHVTAIREACERQCRMYHMGESGASTSLAAFKTQFGAVGYPYAEFRHERLPILSADQKLRAIAKRVIGFRDV
jgi:hypothetical protein